MEEYQKAKLQQLEDNAKFIEAAKLLGMEASYFCGLYTLRLDGKLLGQDTAAGWLKCFRDSAGQAKRD